MAGDTGPAPCMRSACAVRCAVHATDDPKPVAASRAPAPASLPPPPSTPHLLCAMCIPFQPPSVESCRRVLGVECTGTFPSVAHARALGAALKTPLTWDGRSPRAHTITHSHTRTGVKRGGERRKHKQTSTCNPSLGASARATRPSLRIAGGGGVCWVRRLHLHLHLCARVPRTGAACTQWRTPCPATQA